MRIMRTLTLNDTVMLISLTKLGGELLPERRLRIGVLGIVLRIVNYNHIHIYSSNQEIVYDYHAEIQ